MSVEEKSALSNQLCTVEFLRKQNNEAQALLASYQELAGETSGKLSAATAKLNGMFRW
jgi:hypothetical protein